MNVESISAIDYLRDKNIEYYTEGENCKEGWVNVRCPFCNDASNHLGINEDTNIISCWRCKTSGTIFKYVMKMERMSFEQVTSLLSNYKRIVYNKVLENITRNSVACKIPKTNKFPPIPKMIKDFLNNRGISEGNLIRHAEGWTGPYDKYPMKIFFPITYKRRTVTYVMRDFSGKADIKYVNYPEEESEMSAKDLLYGYDEAPNNSVLVGVEGIIDKLKLGPRAVAFLGVGFTKQQVLKISEKKPKKFYILFDTETQAQKLAKNLAQAIWFCPTEVIQLTHHNDPGELSEEEGSKLMSLLT